MVVGTGRSSVRWICALWLMTLGPSAWAEERESVTDWLSAMKKAVTSLDYQGNVTYIKDQQIDTFKLFHARIEGVEREHLISMNSPLREMVRVGGTLTRSAQDSHEVAVETQPADQSLLISLPDDPKTLERYYHLSFRGREYVAGRLTQVVVLEPRDGYRYTRLFWVDVDTHLPLKLDVLNEEGHSVEQVIFTTLNARDPISAKELEPTLKSASPAPQVKRREPQSLKDLKWTLTRVPDGFQIVALTTLHKGPDQTPVEQILISDGFSAVSIYVEPKDHGKPLGARKMGAVNAESVLYRETLVTVMGEVPMAAVQLIAKGFSEKLTP